jgi:hypothetical protein
MDQFNAESLVSLIEGAVAKANGPLDEKLTHIDRRIGEIEDVLKQLMRVAGVMDPTEEDEATGPSHV